MLAAARQRFTPFGIALAAGVAALLALSVYFHIQIMDTRPLHGDEAVQGVFLGKLLETGNLRFHPEHFHGPLPHLLHGGALALFGARGYADLSPVGLRAGALAAGVCALLLIFGAARASGRIPALLALALACAAPLAFYYNGIYFHENFLLAAALLCPIAAWVGFRTRARSAWAIAGAAFGAMVATKSTWLVVALGWACGFAALAVLVRGFKMPSCHLRSRVRRSGVGVALAAATALVVALACYTEGFSRWAGALDAVKTFWVYTTDPGHEKPFFYYFAQILFYRDGFGEAALTLPALFGFVRVVVSQKTRARTPRFALWLALAGAAQIFGYSLVAYKTPWLMLVPLAYLAPFAGWSLWDAALRPEFSARRKIAGAALVACLLAFDVAQIARAMPERESQTPPPFAYVPTSTDVPRLMSALLAATPEGDIAVVSPDESVWPIPYYLRAAADRTGYFYGETPEGNFAAYVFVNAAPPNALAERLRRTHEKRVGNLFLPAHPFAVYVPKPQSHN